MAEKQKGAGVRDLIARVRRRVTSEDGVIRKHGSIRIALCAPTTYHVGMSSLGFQTIYREINRHPDAAAERAFLPENPADYRNARIPAFTYEHETPLSEFPVVAFSVSYELELAGFLEMLDLSGIPLLRTDRSERHPLILVGGPITYSNPLPLAPFSDLIMLGEGEDLIHAFLDAAASSDRGALLESFSSSPVAFVPGRSESPRALAQVGDDRLPAYSQILTKHTVLKSMFLIEPERGCSRGCTYCVMRRTVGAGMRPVPPAAVLSLIPERACRVGLVGAAVTDHPRIKEIIRKIVESGREIGISSLRADRLDRELVGLLARGGCRTLTTASDGASQRLRNLIGRRTGENDLIGAAELVRHFRLDRLKLYQMIGLPGETEADLDELIRFAGELAKIAPLSLSVAPFVAKRNTPLDGAPFEEIPSLEAKLSKLRSSLKGRAEIRPTSVRWAWVEFMLSQAGEEAGLAACDAWRAGGSFSSWKRAFRMRQVGPRPP